MIAEYWYVGPHSLYVVCSAFTYIKFFSVWMFVLMADFILDFRFEYLWPLWLLARSVCDSMKYQGLVSCNCFLLSLQCNIWIHCCHIISSAVRFLIFINRFGFGSVLD